MFVGTRELAATVVASTIVLGGSWIYAAHAQPDQASCARVVDLADRMAETNGHFIATMGARSVALRYGMTSKVETLTPKMEALRAEYQSLHLEMREAAATCR